MIWRIFRKDLRSLWPFVLGIIVGDFAVGTIQVAMGLVPFEHPVLNQVGSFVNMIVSALNFFTIVMVVQRDALADDRLDWLVRPIKRSDLFLAKLLFVALCIHVPLFFALLFQGLGGGFSFGQSLSNALSGNVLQFFYFSIGPIGAGIPGTLAAMAFGTLARNIGHALGLGLAILVGALATFFAVGYALGLLDIPQLLFNVTLAHWVLKLAVIILVMSAILALQYVRRATNSARITMVAGALVVTLSQVLLPQGAALAVQNTVLPSPGQSISVAFAPQNEKPHIAATGGDFTGRLVSLQTTPVYLPLRLTGIAPDLMLVAENIFVTFTAPGGQSENVPLTDNNPLPLHVPGQADDAAPLYQIVWVPNEFYRAHAGQKLRVDITFALGIARPGTSYKLAAMGGNLRTPEGLWCATRLNIERSVGLNCMKPSNVRLRVSAALVDQAGASRNPVQVSYSPSDAPSYGGLVAISRLSLSMPLRDIHTGDRYPVSSQNVSTAKIAVTLNQPLTHIARKVTIEDFRLSDWKADITGKAP